MQVGDIMTGRVIGIRPDASIGDAAALMLAHRISGLPVIDADGTLVGMLSEGDFLRRAEIGTQRQRPWWLRFLASPGQVAEEYVHSHGRKVREVMAKDVATTTEAASLATAVDLMYRNKVKRLPVLRDGKVVGIVARSDLLQAVARASQGSAAGVEASDRTIRAAVLAELSKHKWFRGNLVRVTVRDGIVALNGTILDERERDALRVAAENTPGVKGVSDQLTWLEPVTSMIVVPADPR